MLTIQTLHWGGAMGKISQTAITEMDYHMGACAQGDTLERDKYELMQFTGLTDKNGTEIYEGDVIVIIDGYEDECSKVQWNEESASFTLSNYSGLGFDEYEPKQIEVIGNLYENPDLLKEAK